MTPETEQLIERPRWTSLTIVPIASGDEYVQCAEYLKTIKAFQQRVTAFFGPHKDRAYKAWKALCADETTALAPALADERACKAVLVDYDARQAAARAAEEARLSELARQAEETRRLEEAAALEREGAIEEAAAILDEPISTPAVLLESTTPKVAGLSYREQWSARIVSLPKLIAYVAAHPEHANLLTPNLPALNGLARSLKSGLRIDGVEAVRSTSAAARPGQ